MTRSAPSGRGPTGYLTNVQGTSADGSVTVLRTSGELEVDAGPKAAPGTPIKLSAINSQGQTAAGQRAAERPGEHDLLLDRGPRLFDNPRESNLDNAVSEDGSHVFWTANSSRSVASGKIYLRIDGKNPTLAVSAGGEALSGKRTHRRS